MDVIDLLKKLVAINSVNPFKTVSFENKEIGIGNEKKIAEYLEKELTYLGFKVERQIVQEEIKDLNVPERFNLLAEKGEGKSSVLLMGHMDTVGVKKGWKSNPFKVEIKNGKIFGLGTNDMKAGLAIILKAVESFQPNYKLKIAFVVDEEYYSFGADTLVKSSFLEDVEYALVPEVGEYERKTPHQNIILGRMGRTEYEFFIEGKSCHGAQIRLNEDNINAVHESVKLQKKIIVYCDFCKQVFSSGNITITNSAYISVHEGGEATLSVPEQASFLLDRSFAMNENMEFEINILKTIVEEAYSEGILHPDVKVIVKEKPRPVKPCKPYFISPEDDFVKTVTKAVETITGNYEYGIGFSVADENRLVEKGIKTITLGPLGFNSHASQEWADVQSIKDAVKIYRAILENLLN